MNQNLKIVKSARKNLVCLKDHINVKDVNDLFAQVVEIKNTMFLLYKQVNFIIIR